MEKLLRDSGLENCNALSTPGVKEPTNSEKSWFEGESTPHGEVDNTRGPVSPVTTELTVVRILTEVKYGAIDQQWHAAIIWRRIA